MSRSLGLLHAAATGVTISAAAGWLVCQRGLLVCREGCQKGQNQCCRGAILRVLLCHALQGWPAGAVSAAECCPRCCGRCQGDA